MQRLLTYGIFNASLGILVAALIAAGTADAATLILHDGSVINGNIRTLSDDVYTIETASLGTVRVRKQDIRTIDLSDDPGATSAAGASSSAIPAEPAGQAELQALQQSLMQNANLFSMVQSLQNDPQVQAVLADPEVMSAIASGNIEILMSHPKIIALTGNPKVREVIDEVR